MSSTPSSAPNCPARSPGSRSFNPYTEREFLTDKLSIVDVKARDDQGRLYQVEIQLLTYPDLPARILYTWNDIYNKQIQRGQDYRLLKPTYAIWFLGEDLLPDDPGYTHRYRLRDDQGRGFLDHGGICLLELNKFAAEEVETEEQRWLRFFKDGEHLDADRPPEWMQTVEMRQAMSTLKAFSEQEHAYDRYRTRQDFLRQQSCIQGRLREAETALEEQSVALEAERQAKEAERQAKEVERQAKEVERQAKEVALQAREAERQAREAERQAKETALQEKAAALAEVARLTALLHAQTPPADS